VATILLADDDVNFSKLLTMVLGHHGHVVHTAYDGLEALRLFRRNRPQITVLDFQMPKMDGLEVLQQIRATDPQAVVMILTGWGTDKLEQQARRLNVTEFLNKHLPFASIAALVQSVVTEPGRLFTPGTVVLVEQLDQTRNLFKAFIRTHVVSIRTAKDGHQALTMMRVALPQLVVLDMDLGGIQNPLQTVPDMTAPKFLQALRQIRYPGGLILMSDVVEQAIDEQASNLQVLDLMQKPITPERLLVAVQAAMVIMGETSYAGQTPKNAYAPPLVTT